MISFVIRRFTLLFQSGGTLPEPETYTPSLDFSDDRNSQYCSLWG